MMGLLITLHVIICILLMTIVLIQSGRGGGLVEGFTGMESMFGTKTNAFMTRTTTILSILFFITCLSLAVLSAKQGKSLLRNVKPQPAKQAAAQKPEDTPSKVAEEKKTIVETQPQTNKLNAESAPKAQ